jgi:hypothetical protein
MDPIHLSFNVDMDALKKLGVDPSTSEGKAEIKAFIITALNDANMGEGSHYEGREEAMAKALLGEDLI